MSTDEHEYIASTTPGKTWRIDCYKPQGKGVPPVAIAQEGEKTETSFSFAMGLGSQYGDRRIRLPLPAGPLTAKRAAQGRELVRAELLARGWIDAGTGDDA